MQVHPAPHTPVMDWSIIARIVINSITLQPLRRFSTILKVSVQPLQIDYFVRWDKPVSTPFFRNSLLALLSRRNVMKPDHSSLFTSLSSLFALLPRRSFSVGGSNFVTSNILSSTKSLLSHHFPVFAPSIIVLLCSYQNASYTILQYQYLLNFYHSPQE